MTHGRTDAATHSGRHRRNGRANLRPFLRASVSLCACALWLACTDPRARPAPPAVKLYLGPGVVATSPGTIAAAVVVHDALGVDSVHLTLSSPYPNLQGDSLYLVPDTTDFTQSVVWTVPSGIPAGTKITLGAKAWDLLGFAGADSLVLTSK